MPELRINAVVKKVSVTQDFVICLSKFENSRGIGRTSSHVLGLGEAPHVIEGFSGQMVGAQEPTGGSVRKRMLVQALLNSTIKGWIISLRVRPITNGRKRFGRIQTECRGSVNSLPCIHCSGGHSLDLRGEHVQ